MTAKVVTSLEEMNHLLWLAARDIIFFSTYDDDDKEYTNGFYAAVNCNDTFYYASADAESLPFERAEELRGAYELFGFAGVVAWCSLKRGYGPLERLQTEQYRAAMEFLQPSAQVFAALVDKS